VKDYIDVIFKDKPYTNYPKQLTRYLFELCEMKKGSKLLELGSGRGEQLQEFFNLGLNVTGADISPRAKDFLKDIPIIECDINNKLPFEDNSFDFVYSKSLISHLINPSFFMQETYRVLKPGGKLISLVPDWESQYKKMYDDYTLIRPFTKQSLSDIQSSVGYENVFVEHFRQLPIVWKYAFLNIPMKFLSPFIPVRVKNKSLRWIKELMLLSVADKL